jgi:RNase P subunit RPR2
MRIGCIAGSETTCDGCGQIVRFPERYLAIDDEADGEGQTRRYCVECAKAKGYATYRREKGAEVLTFFANELPE